MKSFRKRRANTRGRLTAHEVVDFNALKRIHHSVGPEAWTVAHEDGLQGEDCVEQK